MGFTVTAVNPGLVLGPIVQPISNAADINTSNSFVYNLLSGKHVVELPPTGPFYWVDVQTVALVHALAVERSDAVGRRILVTTGTYSNKVICDIVREEFPAYSSRLPPPATKSGNLPAAGVAQVDNSYMLESMGVEPLSLRAAVVGVVRSLESSGLLCPPKTAPHLYTKL